MQSKSSNLLEKLLLVKYNCLLQDFSKGCLKMDGFLKPVLFGDGYNGSRKKNASTKVWLGVKRTRIYTIHTSSSIRVLDKKQIGGILNIPVGKLLSTSSGWKEDMHHLWHSAMMYQEASRARFWKEMWWVFSWIY